MSKIDKKNDFKPDKGENLYSRHCQNIGPSQQKNKNI
jgi:hypothetical protein